MRKRRLAFILCFVLMMSAVTSGFTSARVFASELDAVSENVADSGEDDVTDALEMAEVSEEAVKESCEADGGDEASAEETVSGAACGDVPAELIKRLEELGMKLNSDGKYEYIEENGDVRIYDPEDPEIFKYFMEDDEEPDPGVSAESAQEIYEDAVRNDSLMSVGGKVHDDPYKLWLDGRTYRYPK